MNLTIDDCKLQHQNSILECVKKRLRYLCHELSIPNREWERYLDESVAHSIFARNILLRLVLQRIHEHRNRTISVLRAIKYRERVFKDLIDIISSTFLRGQNEMNEGIRNALADHCLASVQTINEIHKWRLGLTSDYPFLWKNENYILKLKNDCTRISERLQDFGFPLLTESILLPPFLVQRSASTEAEANNHDDDDSTSMLLLWLDTQEDNNPVRFLVHMSAADIKQAMLAEAIIAREAESTTRIPPSNEHGPLLRGHDEDIASVSGLTRRPAPPRPSAADAVPAIVSPAALGTPLRSAGARRSRIARKAQCVSPAHIRVVKARPASAGPAGPSESRIIGPPWVGTGASGGIETGARPKSALARCGAASWALSPYASFPLRAAGRRPDSDSPNSPSSHAEVWSRAAHASREPLRPQMPPSRRVLPRRPRSTPSPSQPDGGSRLGGAAGSSSCSPGLQPRLETGSDTAFEQPLPRADTIEQLRALFVAASSPLYKVAQGGGGTGCAGSCPYYENSGRIEFGPGLAECCGALRSLGVCPAPLSPAEVGLLYRGVRVAVRPAAGNVLTMAQFCSLMQAAADRLGRDLRGLLNGCSGHESGVPGPVSWEVGPAQQQPAHCCSSDSDEVTTLMK